MLIEAISVVIRMEAIHALYPGGWEGFRDAAPNQTLCADSSLARIGFMSPVDVESFINELEKCGFSYIDSDACMDIAVVDQQQGFVMPCNWAQCGLISMEGNDPKICQAMGDDSPQLMTPDGWRFEGSLSETYIFASTERVDRSFKFLRQKDGMDVYINKITGKEVYLGRTLKS